MISRAAPLAYPSRGISHGDGTQFASRFARLFVIVQHAWIHLGIGGPNLTQPSLPKRLYKYRAFSNRVLDMLVADELYYADPSDFNDQLDSRPNLEADLPADDLEHLLSRFVEQRTKGRDDQRCRIDQISRSEND